jgi:type IV pilus assembly protein PilC
MPEYNCRVVDEDGRTVQRQALASSAGECRKKLEAEGLLVLSVSRDWKKVSLTGIHVGRKIKDRDFVLFNQELVALLKAGYPILRGLETISSRAKNIYLKEILIKIAGEVESGKALSEAFIPYENLFSKVYTASLMAGEKSGNLAGSITRFIQYARVISQTRSRIRSALTYPTVLILFSSLVTGVLVYFILPKFKDFYLSFESEMPGITRLIMSVANAFNQYWYIVFGLLAGLVLLILWGRSRPDFSFHMDRAKLRIPYGRTIWLESGVSLFSRTLGLLLEAGITLLQAVGIAIQAVPNRFITEKMKGLPDLIENGESLSESLNISQIFPLLALDMIRIGESSANLSGMLADVADFYDERIRGRIDTLVTLIEPVVIIFMGLVVAGMLLSVYLPIFNVIRATRF